MMKSRTRTGKLCDDNAVGPGGAKAVLILIIVVHFILAGLYWAHTPFGASPDEGAHLRYVQIIIDSRSFPVFSASSREDYEAHQPPLYYVMGVPLYLLGEAAAAETPGEFVRLLSVLIGAASIYVLYRAVLAAFPDRRPIALASAAFAALLPTHVMLSSSVSNDILMELVFGLALTLLALTLRKGLAWTRTVLLGMTLGVGLLTKSTCALLFPVSLIVFLMVWRGKEVSGSVVAVHGLAAGAIGLLVGGWWLLRNTVLYGDPLAASLFQSAFQHTATPEFWLSQGWSWRGYFGLVGLWTFASFWGVFGHMNIFMPWPTYAGLALVSAVAGVGAARAGIAASSESTQERSVLIVFVSTLILVVLAFIQFNLHFFQAQGRYLYPALVPIAVFWVLGIEAALPMRWRHVWPYVAVGVVVIVQLIALSTCIIPRMPYYS